MLHRWCTGVLVVFLVFYAQIAAGVEPAAEIDAAAKAVFENISEAGTYPGTPTHWIVLFDDSGSTGTLRRSRDLTAMIVREVIEKAPSVPNLNLSNYNPNDDRVSILFFSVGYCDIDYREMIYTTTTLELLSGPLANASYSINSGATSRYRRGKSMSPIVTSIPASFAYLGENLAARHDEFHPGRVVLVRITDADYNTTASASEELRFFRYEVSDGICRSNIENEDWLRAANNAVNRTFDLSSHTAECTFDADYSELDCSAGALFESNKKDLYITYIDARVRGGIEFLVLPKVAETESRRTAWSETEVRDESTVELTLFRGDAAELGMTAEPRELLWSIEDQSTQKIVRAGSQTISDKDRDKSANWLVTMGDLISPIRPEDSLKRYNIRWAGRYDVEIEKTTVGKTEIDLYPFTLTQFGVPARTTIYPSEESTGRLRKQGLLWGLGREISDDLLKSKFPYLGTPNHRIDAQQYQALTASYHRYFWTTFWTVVALVILYLLFWPRPAIKLQAANAEESDVEPAVVDFERRYAWRIGENKIFAEKPQLVGSFTIEDDLKNRWWCRLQRRPQMYVEYSCAPHPRVKIVGSQAGPVKLHEILELDPDRPLFTIGSAAKADLQDAQAKFGKTYLLLMDPNAIRDSLQDSPLDPDTAQAFTEMQIRVHVSAIYGGWGPIRWWHARRGAGISSGKPVDGVDLNVTLRLVPESTHATLESIPFRGKEFEKQEVKLGDYRDVRCHRNEIDLNLFQITIKSSGHCRYSRTVKSLFSLEDIREYQTENAQKGTDLKGGQFYFWFNKKQMLQWPCAVKFNQPATVEIKAATIRVVPNPPYPALYYKFRLADEQKKINQQFEAEIRTDERLTNVSARLLDGKNVLAHLIDGPNKQVINQFKDPNKGVVACDLEANDDGVETVRLIELANTAKQGNGYLRWKMISRVADRQGNVIGEFAAIVRQGIIRDSMDPVTIELGFDKPAMRRYLQSREGEFTIDDITVASTLNVECWQVDRGNGTAARAEAGEYRQSSDASINEYRLEGNPAQDIPLKKVGSYETNVFVPVEVEALHTFNWVCIDFGTQAISGYSLQAEIAEGATPLNFQQHYIKNVQHDEHNEEEGTTFIPSACNIHEGAFAAPAKCKSIEDASFVMLPAHTHTMLGFPDRCLFAVKSLFSHTVGKIHIRQPVSYLDENSQPQQGETFLPSDSLLVGMLKHIKENYLEQMLPWRKFSQLVVTHPNTYTQNEIDLFGEIVKRGFKNEIHPNHLRLVSESDAAAAFYWYHFCKDRQPGEERILVYDIGAGTTDLTLMTVVWKKTPEGRRAFPEQEVIHGRAGIPIAGNKFDEILARIVHEQLEDYKKDGKLDYLIPIVSEDAEDNQNRPKAMYFLRCALCEAKKKLSELNGSMSPIDIPICDDQIPIVYFEGERGSKELGIWKETQGGRNLIFLRLRPQQILENELVQGYLRFLSQVVLEQFFTSLHIDPNSVNTLALSGRGLKLLGLKDAIVNFFARQAGPPLSVADFSSIGQEGHAQQTPATDEIEVIFEAESAGGAGLSSDTRGTSSLKNAVAEGAILRATYYNNIKTFDLNRSGTFLFEIAGFMGEPWYKEVFPGSELTKPMRRVEGSRIVARYAYKHDDPGMTFDLADARGLRIVRSIAKDPMKLDHNPFAKYLHVAATDRKSTLLQFLQRLGPGERSVSWKAHMDPETNQLTARIFSVARGIPLDVTDNLRENRVDIPWPFGKNVLTRTDL